MSYYFKPSFESIDVAPEVSTNEAPVTGIDENIQSTLKKATIVGLIEDYIKCGIICQYITSFEQAVEFVKNICNAALSGGDIDSADFDHINTWLNAHRSDFNGSAECAKKKFLCHVLTEEVAEIVNCEESENSICAEFVNAANAKKQCEQMCEDLRNKYGEIVLGYAKEFISLYGRSFNESFLKRLNLI